MSRSKIIAATYLLGLGLAAVLLTPVDILVVFSIVLGSGMLALFLLVSIIVAIRILTDKETK